MKRLIRVAIGAVVGRHLLCMVLTLSTFIAIGCGEPTCYTCKGFLGTLPQTVSNVCGPDLLKYYQNIGYSCSEESSTSNPVSNITDPDKNNNSETNLIAIEDSECPCKNKDKIKIDDSVN